MLCRLAAIAERPVGLHCEPMPAAVPGGVDLVVLGATGFTGRLACEYLAEHAPADLKWAMAGRSLSKLKSLQEELPASAKSVPLLEVDVKSVEALQEMAKGAKVVANFAGSPYSDKGLPVVAACAETGCSYVDITGEPPFMRASADRYDEKARETGALIIHACGYDSVPSDLGALLAATAMKDRHSVECTKIRLYVGESSGGVSGGTLESAMYIIAQGDNIEGAAAAKGPYGLDPPGSQGGPDTGDFGEVSALPRWDEDEKLWAAPFVMAPVNARVVRRSNALSGYAYGKATSYGEVMEVPGPLSGVGMVCGLGFGAGLLFLSPTRWLLKKLVLPAPGQGPSKTARENGFFNTRIVATGEKKGDGPAPKTVAHVKSGNGGDPGYKCTARMAIESALCCALERAKCYKPGGVVTPAVGLGRVLVDRLNASGMQLYVDP